MSTSETVKYKRFPIPQAKLGGSYTEVKSHGAVIDIHNSEREHERQTLQNESDRSIAAIGITFGAIAAIAIPGMLIAAVFLGRRHGARDGSSVAMLNRSGTSSIRSLGLV